MFFIYTYSFETEGRIEGKKIQESLGSIVVHTFKYKQQLKQTSKQTKLPNKPQWEKMEPICTIWSLFLGTEKRAQ